MSTPPWLPDRSLTLETASLAIAKCFPTINTAELQYLSSGWEFDAYLTSDSWVFRFPRRAECANLFDAERGVLQLVARALPAHVAIPRVELMGTPTNEFPYRFAGHRFVAGVPAHTVDTKLLPTIAQEIALALGALHSIPEEDARNAGITEGEGSNEGREYWLQHGIKSAQQLRGLDPVVDQAVIWLAQTSLPTESLQRPLQLVHQDLGTDHVLVNPVTGALTGILDWTDAMLGDAARDFVFLAAWQGWSFFDQVLKLYPRAVDSEFRQRVRFMSQLLTTMWLAYALEQGEDLSPHIQWVRNVFAPGSA